MSVSMLNWSLKILFNEKPLIRKWHLFQPLQMIYLGIIKDQTEMKTIFEELNKSLPKMNQT